MTKMIETKRPIVKKKLILEFEIDGFDNGDTRTETPLCSLCRLGGSLLGFTLDDWENAKNGQTKCPLFEACHRNGCAFPHFVGFTIS